MAHYLNRIERKNRITVGPEVPEFEGFLSQKIYGFNCFLGKFNIFVIRWIAVLEAGWGALRRGRFPALIV